jgi:hypothetical protein
MGAKSTSPLGGCQFKQNLFKRQKKEGVSLAAKRQANAPFSVLLKVAEALHETQSGQIVSLRKSDSSG